ncbi:MAG TPA: hypothetical protein DCG14_06715, partial [Phycisphaerales bacterium]|nr:hypothetical protein [Phycisphaerales bacterium]
MGDRLDGRRAFSRTGVHRRRRLVPHPDRRDRHLFGDRRSPGGGPAIRDRRSREGHRGAAGDGLRERRGPGHRLRFAALAGESVVTDAPRLRLGCLISGGGRTVLNLQTAIDRDAIPADIVTVIAHREDLPGVERCRAAGLPVEIVTESGPGPVDETLQSARVDLVCLCGYLRRFAVEPRWTDRVVNIHPALLPAHGG